MYSRQYDLSPRDEAAGGRGGTGGGGGDRRDAASILMWSLNAWYKGQQQTESQARRKLYRLRSRTKAQEDEKSFYHHGDWSEELSLDQPTYGSIFMQIKEANTESEGSVDFLRKAVEIFASTILVTLILGSLIALPVGMISVGTKFLHECPAQPKIPIYLMVGGCFGLLKLLSLLWKQVRSRRYERLDEIVDEDEDNGDVIMSKSSRFSEALLSIFLFVWFICGNYWVFSVWRPSFRQLLHDPSNWCDETVYMLAFVQICICYGVMGLIIVIMTLLFICHQVTMNRA